MGEWCWEVIWIWHVETRLNEAWWISFYYLAVAKKMSATANLVPKLASQCKNRLRLYTQLGKTNNRLKTKFSVWQDSRHKMTQQIHWQFGACIYCIQYNTFLKFFFKNPNKSKKKYHFYKRNSKIEKKK